MARPPSEPFKSMVKPFTKHFIESAMKRDLEALDKRREWQNKQLAKSVSKVPQAAVKGKGSVTANDQTSSGVAGKLTEISRKTTEVKVLDPYDPLFYLVIDRIDEVNFADEAGNEVLTLVFKYPEG